MSVEIIILGLFIFTSSFSWAQESETVTVTSYYPAPYGEYQELRLSPKNAAPTCTSAGTLYYNTDGNLYACNGTGSWIKLSSATPTGGGPKTCPGAFLRKVQTDSNVNPTYNTLAGDCYTPPLSTLPDSSAKCLNAGDVMQTLSLNAQGGLTNPGCVPKSQLIVDKTKGMIWKRVLLVFPGQVIAQMETLPSGLLGQVNYHCNYNTYVSPFAYEKAKIRSVASTVLGQPCSMTGVGSYYLGGKYAIVGDRNFTVKPGTSTSECYPPAWPGLPKPAVTIWDSYMVYVCDYP